ncbi:DASH complex subunit ASK1 [Rhodotorula toruloides]|uniref:DASH complex subunit ASK1 n=1 Tax=Rhodotorula toruloides TaxID=5286 RepID=A0A511K9I4_RHOTO|nr:DASH complex subunit ASK1 [Rhodotorula toruloides]
MPPFRDPNRLFYDSANPVMLPQEEILQLSPAELQAATDQLDQNLVLLLRRVEENFARCNQVVTERILPAVEVHGENSARIYESIKFWRPFFEAAASIRLNEPYADDTSSTGADELSQATVLASPERTISDEGDVTYGSHPSLAADTPRDAPAIQRNDSSDISLPSAPHWSTDMSPYQDLQKELKRDTSALEDFSALRKDLPEVQRLNLRDLPPDSPDLPEPTAFGGDLPDLPGNGRAYRFGAAEELASPAPRGVRAGGDKTHSALLEKILRKGLASPAPSRVGRGPESSTPSGAPATGSRLKFPSDVPKNWDGIANLSTTSLNSFPSPIKRRTGAQNDSMFGAPPSIASSRAYLSSPAPPASSSAFTSRRAPPSTAASSSSFLSRTPAKEAARRTALNVYDSLALDSPPLELAPPTMRFDDLFGNGQEEKTPGLDSPSQRSTLSQPGGALRSGASAAGNDSYLASAPAQPSFVDRSPTQVFAQHDSSSSSVSRDVPLADFGGGTTANIDDLLAGAPTMTYDHRHNPLAGPIDPQQYAGIVNDDGEPHQPTGGYGADESFTGDAEDDQPHHLNRREEPTYTGYDDYEQSLAGHGGGRGLRLPGQDGPEDTLFGMPPGRGGADAAKAGGTARFADVEDDSFTDSGGVDGGKSGFRLHGLSDMETLHGGELLSSEPFQASPLAGKSYQ